MRRVGDPGLTGPKSTLSSWSVILPEFQRFRSSLLADIFGVKGSNRSIHTDEIVAYGAAIQAAIPIYGTSTRAYDLPPLVIAPLSPDIETASVVITKLIPRTSTTPTKKSESFVSLIDLDRLLDLQGSFGLY